jgi:hypothetical protein
VKTNNGSVTRQVSIDDVAVVVDLGGPYSFSLL